MNKQTNPSIDYHTSLALGNIRVEKHHVIPVSMSGEDWDENKYLLVKEDHALIHKIQNITFWNVRSYRLKTNSVINSGVPMLSHQFSDELLKLWKGYFGNIENIPEKQSYLIKIQIESLLKQTNAYSVANGDGIISRDPILNFAFTESILEDLIIQQRKKCKNNILRIIQKDGYLKTT